MSPLACAFKYVSRRVQISKDLKIHRASVSRILIDLEKKGFVKCLNPEDITARFYDITDKGSKLLVKYKKFLKK